MDMPNHNFLKYYCILKKMMNCIDEMQYNNLEEEALELWYTLSKEEQDILNELTKLFRLVQTAKPWIQDFNLRNELDLIVPKISRDQIFFQLGRFIDPRKI
jgi:hypothetical protein